MLRNISSTFRPIPDFELRIGICRICPKFYASEFGYMGYIALIEIFLDQLVDSAQIGHVNISIIYTVLMHKFLDR